MTTTGRASTLRVPFSKGKTAYQYPNIMLSHLVDEAAKKIPNVPLLVNVISKRVRQLTAGHRPMIEVGPRMGWADIALTEVIEGKLGYELKQVPEDKE